MRSEYFNRHIKEPRSIRPSDYAVNKYFDRIWLMELGIKPENLEALYEEKRD